MPPPSFRVRVENRGGLSLDLSVFSLGGSRVDDWRGGAGPGNRSLVDTSGSEGNPPEAFSVLPRSVAVSFITPAETQQLET
jgi:hypothetical protein